MEKISLHPVWEETWDLLPFSPGWKQRCLPPRMSVTEKLSSPVKCSGLLDPGSRVTFAELRKQTPAFWEGLTSPWEELAPGRSKPEFPSLVYGTYTGTPTLCRGWWVWVRWGKWSAGIYVAAINETPPCSDLPVETWERFGPFEIEVICLPFFCTPKSTSEAPNMGFFRVSILWIIVRPFSFAGY